MKAERGAKARFWFLLIVAAGLVAGLACCVPQESLFPLYTDNDLVTDDNLLGTWVDSDGAVYTFEKSTREGEKAYTLTLASKDMNLRSKVHLLRLEKFLFVDLSAAEMADEEQKVMEKLKNPYPLTSVHTFGRMRIDHDSARIALLDDRWVFHLYHGYELPIELADREEGRLLIAPTPKLQKFALQYAEDKDAFSFVVYLCRQGRDCQLETLQQKVQDEPDDVGSMYELALAYMHRDRHSDAWATWKHAVSLKPDATSYRTGVFSDLSGAFIQWGHPEEGLSVLHYRTENDPKDKDAWNQLGWGYLSVNRNEEALAAFRKAAELEPGKADSHFAFGAAHMDMGDFETARKDYLEALGLSPGYSAAQQALAFTFFAQGNYAAADREFEKYFEMEKSPLSYAVLWQSLVLRHLGKQDAARKVLDDYSKSFEDTPWQKALLDYHRGQLSEANLLAKVQPPRGQVVSGELCEAYFYIGYQHLLEGNRTKARELFRMAISTRAYNYFEFTAAKARLENLEEK